MKRYNFLIDYASGQHGHFLEYIINRYMFNINPTVSLFDAVGACDGVNLSTEYVKQKKILCTHLSSAPDIVKTRYTDDVKVMYIKDSNDIQFDFIHLINVFHKAGSNGKVTFDKRTKEILSDKKNNFYNKLQDKRYYEFISMDKELTHITDDVFYFNFESFFKLENFIKELELTAKFLNHLFRYDDSLIEIWDEFIKQNQGYNLLQQANTILDKIIRNESYIIEDNWMIQGYLNLQITKMFDIWDGELFRDDFYPKNTTEVHKILQKHHSTK